MSSVARHPRADWRENRRFNPYSTGATQGRLPRLSMALPPIRTVLYDIFSKPDIVHERSPIADEAEARHCSNSPDEPRRHSGDYHLNRRLSPVFIRLSLSPPPSTQDDRVLLSQDYSQNSQPSSACYVEEYPQRLERRELDSISENTLTPFRSASSSDPLIHLRQDRLERLLRSSTLDQIPPSRVNVEVETTARRRPRQYKKLPRPHQTGCECYIPGGGFPTWKAMLKHVIRSSEQGRLTLSEIRLELRKRFPCVSDTLARHDNTIRQTLSSQSCFDILSSRQHRKNHQWVIVLDDDDSEPA